MVDGAFGWPRECRFLTGLMERQMGKQAKNPHLNLLVPGHMDHKRKSKALTKEGWLKNNKKENQCDQVHSYLGNGKVKEVIKEENEGGGKFSGHRHGL